MRLYQDTGYVDIKSILNEGLPFNFVIGGRATGKTFTTLLEMFQSKTQFMFMRRTQSQADLINKPEFSPFKPIANFLNVGVTTKPLSKYNSGFYHTEMNDDNVPVAVGSPFGYTCALSTISNMRGFDASDVKVLIYDEFIPERHEKSIRNEGSAFLNAYETINRNRELNGEKPLQALCLANANDITNALFLELGLIKIAETMKKRGQTIYINRDRGIGIFFLDDSKISEAKSHTALYKLTKDSDFAKMSLSNDFSSNEVGLIKSCNLKDYKPIVRVGEITIYQHKSNANYYISTHHQGTVQIYGSGDIERSRFRKVYFWLWTAYMNNEIVFEEYLCQVLFEKTFEA